MQFKTPLIPGTLIKRYKRFLMDVSLDDGSMITVHCPNSGSMAGLLHPGNPAWISLSPNPNRKLKYTLEIIQVDGVMVGVNTMTPNILVENVLKARFFPTLNDFDTLKCEVPYGESTRFDFCLTSAGKPKIYIEVKNVSLKENSQALFPDSKTLRGTKHLNELMNVIDQGDRAMMIYIIQRNDCDSFSLAKTIDPLYTATFLQAYEKGVEILAYTCIVSKNQIIIDKPLNLNLNYLK